MFETVAPPRQSQANRSVLYEALSLSLVVHAIAALAALMAHVWEVRFPSQSPVYTIAFALTEAPPPPPPPPPAPKPAESKQEVTTAKLVMPMELLAPTIIPDEIPVVRQEIIAPVDFAVPAGIVGGVADGVDNGVLGGDAHGEEDGKLGGTVGGVGVEVPDGRVHIARDMKLPMSPLSQVYPSYPEDARMRSWEDDMLVRYVIGKDGRVKEVIVLRPPQRDIFVDSTVRAIRSWRFKPMIKDGERQEVVHELTVYYRLNQPAT